MSLIGLPTVTVAAMVAVLFGNEPSRGFASWAYPAYLAVEVGLVGGFIDSIAFVLQATAALAGGIA